MDSRAALRVGIGIDIGIIRLARLESLYGIHALLACQTDRPYMLMSALPPSWPFITGPHRCNPQGDPQVPMESRGAPLGCQSPLVFRALDLFGFSGYLVQRVQVPKHEGMRSPKPWQVRGIWDLILPNLSTWTLGGSMRQDERRWQQGSFA